MNDETIYCDQKEAYETAEYQKNNSNLARSYLELRSLLDEIYSKLEYGDIYQWNDGAECWEKLRKLCA